MKCQRESRFRRGKVAAALSAVDAAYLAGIIDGEGSIMLVGRTPSQSVRAQIAVSNTDLPLLEWIKAAVAVGDIQQNRPAGAKNRASFIWRTMGDGAASVLEQLLPYLKVKLPQAELALRHHADLRIPSRKIDRTWQQSNRLALKAMNQRGGES